MRHAESVSRQGRTSFEIRGRTKKEKILLNDNDVDRRETEFCMQKNAYICNPIVDWTDEDVWNFIKGNNLPYCKLYDDGEKRLGCIGCPMATIRERERFPAIPEVRRVLQACFRSYAQRLSRRQVCQVERC